MSHISKQTATDVCGVSRELLLEGLNIVGAMLEMQGLQMQRVENGISTVYKDKKVLVSVDQKGRVQFQASHGSYRDNELVRPLQEFQSRVEAILPGAVYLAARVQLARAEGKKIEIRVNPETRQLQLAVEV